MTTSANDSPCDSAQIAERGLWFPTARIFFAASHRRRRLVYEAPTLKFIGASAESADFVARHAFVLRH
jgi:hypothetical protein